MNDWIVAGINNPNWTTQDFATIADLNTDNTQLLRKEDYLKSNYIKQQDMFKDSNGRFSERLFSDYYDRRAQEYNELQDNDFYRGPALSVFDIFYTPGNKVRETNFRIQRGVNPDRQAVGIEGINIWSDPVFSQRELAKQNQVYNWDEQKFEDYTVNDCALVRNPVKWAERVFGFKDPLVMAAWDEDGTHIDPMTGLERQHQKGELKLNDKGTYYYETLGDRSVLGKDVLSVFDTFTVDGEGLNKYDFFDSNDVKKSVGGTIVRDVVSLLPMFLGPVGTVYSAVLIGREMAKSLPMLYNMVTMFDPSSTPRWLNDLAAYGEAASFSTSDWAKTHPWAAENMANMISEVALQWGQQQVIAQGFGALRGSNKYLKEAEAAMKARYAANEAKCITEADKVALYNACYNMYIPKAQELASRAGQLGRDASLAYMAIVSNTDVYQDAIDHGASKMDAACIALGSSFGMYVVDKRLHLGELFFDDATPSVTKQARKVLKDEFAAAREALHAEIEAEAPARNKFMRLMSRASETSQRVMTQFSEDLKYHSTGMLGKMIGEGLEEVSEEVAADLSKSLYQLAGQFGLNTSTDNVGAWDNVVQRYLMNFLGGVAGGGIFYGKSVWDSRSFHKPRLDEDIATLIRNGHAKDLRDQLTTMFNEGKAGSRSLSAVDYQLVDTDKGTKIVWLSTADKTKSQAQVIASLVGDRINIIEEVLNGDRLNLSDDELFDNMVLSEKRYLRYKAVAGNTNYYQDFNKILVRLLNAEIDLRQAKSSSDGLPTTTTLHPDVMSKEAQKTYDENVAVYQKKRDDIKLEMDNFLSGDTSLDYTRKLNFMLDRGLHGAFLDIDEAAYFQKKHGHSITTATPEELTKFQNEEWPQYLDDQLKDNLTAMWNKYKELENRVSGPIGNIAKLVPAYKSWAKSIKGLFGEKGALSLNSLENKRMTFDDKFDDETEEEFQSRRTPRINEDTGEPETENEVKERVIERAARIEKHNEEVEREWAANIRAELQKVDMRVDPTTRRMLMEIVGDAGRLRAIIDRKMRMHPDMSIAAATVLNTLKADLSNAEEVLQAVRTPFILAEQRKLNGLLSTVQKLTFDVMQTAADGTESVKETITLQELCDMAGIAAGMGFTIDEMLHCLQKAGEADPTDERYQQQIDVLRTINKTNRDNFANRLEELQTYENGDDQFDIVEVAEGNTNPGLIRKLAEIRVLGSPEPEEGGKVTSVKDKTLKNDIQIAQDVISEVRNNPVYKLLSELKEDVVNPVAVWLQELARAHGDELPDVEHILHLVTERYSDLSDSSDLILDQAERDGLVKVLNYLTELNTFIYAASTVPSKITPFGHNRTANQFAKTHQNKLRSPWEELPEIDSDYAALYLTQIGRYSEEIASWIDFSDMNHNNLIKTIGESDQALNNSLWDTIQGIKDAKLTINGEDHLLFEGIDKIDTSDIGTPTAQLAVYKVIKLFHDNVHKIASEHKMSVVDLWKTTSLLEALGINLKADGNDIYKQQNLKIYSKMTKNDVTAFFKLQYFAAVLTLDPEEFYKDLQQSIEADEKVVPVVGQELGVYFVRAAMTDDFHSMIAYAHSQLKDKRRPALAKRTIFINGVAGAGKSKLMSVFADSKIKGKQVLVCGATPEIAEEYARALGRDSSMNKDQMLEYLIEAETLKGIRAEMDNWKFPKAADGSVLPYDGKYIRAYRSEGLSKISLKLENIKFNDLKNPPVAIYFDEATYMSTVEALLLAEAADHNKAVVILAGDTAQTGYIGRTSEMSNIDEGALFMARTPHLTLSFRENNIQKQSNQGLLRSYVEEIQRRYLYGTVSEYKEYLPTMINLLHAYQPQIYMEDDLNGDLITPELDQHVIDILKNATQNVDPVEGRKLTVAFVYDPKRADGKSWLKKLRDAGVEIPDSQVFAPDTIQGREFDYVVIDKNFVVPGLSDRKSTREFLSEFYTLMTRSRRASIFLANNLPNIIGVNIVSTHKAMAPSTDAGRKNLRAQKKKVLDAILSLSAKPKEAAKPAEKPTEKTPEPKKPAKKTETHAEAGAGGGNKEDTETKNKNEAAAGNNEEKTGEPTVENPVETPTETPAEEPAAGEPKPKDIEFPEPPSGANQNEDEVVPEEPPVEPENHIEESPKNPEADFTDPDEVVGDTHVIEDFNTIVNTEASAADGTQPMDTGGTTIMDFPIECWSNVHLLSVSQSGEKKTKTKKTSDGKTIISTGYEWTVSRPKDGPLRNLQALLAHDRTRHSVFYYKDKIALQNELFKVKSFLLFDHEWGNEINGYSAPQALRNNFNRTDWENGHYELEVRLADESDVLSVHSPYSEAGFEYGPDNDRRRVVASVIYVVADKLGRECRFDIAALNSPETLYNNQDLIRDNARKKSQTTLGDEARARLAAIADNVNEAASKYVEWFSSLYNKLTDPANKGKALTAVIPDNVVQKNKTTWFRKLAEGESIRFGGTFDPNNTAEDNVRDLVHMNPDKVFSGIYTYTGREEDFKLMDPSLKGHAFVLVSSDVLLDPDQLLSLWMEQKRNPNSNTPVVRCVVLDNYGMAFSAFLDDNFTAKFQNGNREDYQFRMNFLGIRMFTSIWNARIAAKQFNNAVFDLKSRNGWSSEHLANVLYLQDQMYISENDRLYSQEERDRARAEVSRVLADPALGITEEDVAKIVSFNEGLQNIPLFRLGHARDEVRGFHIQDFGGRNYIAINEDTARKFEKMLDTVVPSIVAPDSKAALDDQTMSLAKAFSLNTYLSKEDGTAWGADEYIDIEEATHRFTLSGLLTKQEQTIKIQADQGDGTFRNVALANGDEWSVVPRVLVMYARAVTGKQHADMRGDLDSSDTVNLSYITYTNENGKKAEKKGKLMLSFGNLFDPNEKLLRTDIVNREGQPMADPTFLNMFNLIFHGTTDDFHENNTPQADDAYFKHGFFINPDIVRSEVAGVLEGIPGTSGKILFYQIATHPGLFTVDININATNVNIALGELTKLSFSQYDPKVSLEERRKVLNRNAAAPVESYVDRAQTYETEHPLEASIIKRVKRMFPDLDFTYDEDGAAAAMETWNDNQNKTILTDTVQLEGITPEEVMAMPYVEESIDDDGNFVYTAMSLGDYLSTIKGITGQAVIENGRLVIRNAETGQSWTITEHDGVMETVGATANQTENAEPSGIPVTLAVVRSDGKTYAEAAQLWLDESLPAVTKVPGDNIADADFVSAKGEFKTLLSGICERGEITSEERAQLKEDRFFSIRVYLFNYDEDLATTLFEKCIS